jgi:Ca-activated chloride channel family protein
MDAVRQAGVTVYTIGVGQARRSLMSSFFGIQTPDMGDADLKRLAAETDGRYFQASDLKGLAEVYRQIDRLEPEETEERFYRPSVELFFYPLLVALLLAGLWGLKVGERK